MSMEKLNPSEHQPSNHGEIERAAAEQLKKLERSGEQPVDRQEALESARKQLKRTEAIQPQHDAAPKDQPLLRRPVLTRAVNYTQTMASLQHRMKPASRQFSKVIHAAPVEKASEVLGKTVLRPSVSLGATSCAVLVAGSLYLYARYYGLRLSGSEIWLSLVVGGIIGLVIEAIYNAGRRSRS